MYYIGTYVIHKSIHALRYPGHSYVFYAKYELAYPDSGFGTRRHPLYQGGASIQFFSQAGGTKCTDNTVQCSHRFHKDTQVHILRRHKICYVIQSLRDRLSLSVLEDGSRKAERLENFLVKSNSTVQKFLYWDFLANILPSRFLLPMPTVTTYRATSVGPWKAARGTVVSWPAALLPFRMKDAVEIPRIPRTEF